MSANARPWYACGRSVSPPPRLRLRRVLAVVAAAVALLPGTAAADREATRVRIAHGGRSVEVSLAALGLEGARGHAVVRDAARWRTACDALSDELVDDPPFDGDLAVSGDDVVALEPASGEAIDCDALVRAIDARSGASAVVDAPVVARSPRLTSAAIDAARDEVRALLRGPIELDARAPEGSAHAHVVLSPDALGAALRVSVVEGDAPHVDLSLDPAALEASLGPALAALGDRAEDARFAIDPTTDRVRVRPSKPGIQVDARSLFGDASAAAKRPDRKGTLTVARGEPELTTKEAEALRVTGLVASFTTRHPCCQPRVQNIHRMADLVDGALVRPGARFSLNHRVGPRTEKRGFVRAPSIGEGEIVETYGGGVSQVATTLYNAVFDGGYPVVTRKPHSYWFSRYPMGIEATISWPRPDFVFRNDSGAGVLVRISYTDERVTVKLYGDVEGRKVRRFSSKPFDFKPPRVEWEPDEARSVDDPPKVKSAGTRGFRVRVGRDVIFPDGTTKHEERVVHYRGHPRVLVAHPCAIPRGEKGHRSKHCPKPAPPREEAAAPEPTEAPADPPPELEATPEGDGALDGD